MSLLGNGNSNLTWLGQVYTNDSIVAAALKPSQNVAARDENSIRARKMHQ